MSLAFIPVNAYKLKRPKKQRKSPSCLTKGSYTALNSVKINMSSKQFCHFKTGACRGLPVRQQLQCWKVVSGHLEAALFPLCSWSRSSDSYWQLWHLLREAVLASCTLLCSASRELAPQCSSSSWYFFPGFKYSSSVHNQQNLWAKCLLEVAGYTWSKHSLVINLDWIFTL